VLVSDLSREAPLRVDPELVCESRCDTSSFRLVRARSHQCRRARFRWRCPRHRMPSSLRCSRRHRGWKVAGDPLFSSSHGSGTCMPPLVLKSTGLMYKPSTFLAREGTLKRPCQEARFSEVLPFPLTLSGVTMLLASSPMAECHEGSIWRVGGGARGRQEGSDRLAWLFTIPAPC